jgi:hypothetical protein
MEETQQQMAIRAVEVHQDVLGHRAKAPDTSTLSIGSTSAALE